MSADNWAVRVMQCAVRCMMYAPRCASGSLCDLDDLDASELGASHHVSRAAASGEGDN